MFGVKGNLTPGQRAFLKFCETLLAGALLAGVQAVAPLLSNLSPSAVDWASVGHTFLAAASLAVMLGVSKYHTAQGDAPLSSLPSSPAPEPGAASPTAGLESNI